MFAGLIVPVLLSAQTVPTKSGMVVEADGTKIHYIEAGTFRTTGSFRAGGPPLKAGEMSNGVVTIGELRQQPSLLFVPGWTMPAWIWEKQIDHFSKSHHVIAMDPRGQGESSKPTEGYFPAARARDIKAVVDQLKIAPVVLVGWSMGVGEVVSYVDQFGSKDLAGIILVDGIAGADFSPQMTTTMLGVVGDFLKDRDKLMGGFIPSMYKKPQAEQYIQRVIAASRLTPTTAAVSLFLGLITTDNRPALAKIDRPTLICTAPGGPWDAVYEDMQKRITGSRLEKFDGAGHALFADAADKFNTILDEFMKSLAPKP